MTTSTDTDLYAPHTVATDPACRFLGLAAAGIQDCLKIISKTERPASKGGDSGIKLGLQSALAEVHAWLELAKDRAGEEPCVTDAGRRRADDHAVTMWDMCREWASGGESVAPQVLLESLAVIHDSMSREPMEDAVARYRTDRRQGGAQ